MEVEDSGNAAKGTVTCLLASSRPERDYLQPEAQNIFSGIRRRLICLIRSAPLHTFIGHTFALALAAGEYKSRSALCGESFFFQFNDINLNKTHVVTLSTGVSLCSCTCQ